MKKDLNRQIANKLRSKSGESISETLVALLISALALVMLAGAIAAASNMVTRTREKLNKYYIANNYVARQTGDIADGDRDKAEKTTKNIVIKDSANNEVYSKTGLPAYVNKVFSNHVIAYKDK